MNNIIGKTFGRLTVIEKTNERYSDGSILYLCSCSCGNTIKTTSSRLKSGHVKSCGCTVYGLEKHIGERFGRLVVTSICRRRGVAKTYFECQCDCGNKCMVRSDSLISGLIVSCGCRNKEIKDNIYLRNKDFVDGTNLGMIKPDRKLNSNNRTGVKGVSFIASKQKYRAQITIKGKLINLGEYDTLEEAKIAREKGEDEYFKPILGKEN